MKKIVSVPRCSSLAVAGVMQKQVIVPFQTDNKRASSVPPSRCRCPVSYLHVVVIELGCYLIEEHFPLQRVHQTSDDLLLLHKLMLTLATCEKKTKVFSTVRTR